VAGQQPGWDTSSVVWRDRIYLALCRREGRPNEADRELWRGVRDRVSVALLIDMVVFNDRGHLVDARRGRRRRPGNWLIEPVTWGLGYRYTVTDIPDTDIVARW